jgi:hypothetical protein
LLLPEQGPMVEAFRAWLNFDLLTGAPAGTLTGLVFVAASLGANLVGCQGDRRPPHFRHTDCHSFHHGAARRMLYTIPTQTCASLGMLRGGGVGYEAAPLWGCGVNTAKSFPSRRQTSSGERASRHRATC